MLDKQKTSQKNPPGAFVILCFAALAFAVYSHKSPPDDTPPDSAAVTEQKAAAVALIRLAGYRCDDVTTLRPALTGGGSDQVARCNEGRYTYDLQDIGGRWTVTPN